MVRKISQLSSQSACLLHRLGERLHLLRVRHRLSAKQMAASAGMSVMTLRSLERGGEGVAIGAYLAVMAVLGVERDLDELAAAAFMTETEGPELVARAPRPRLHGSTDGISAVSAKRGNRRPAVEPVAVHDSPSSDGTNETPSGMAAASMPDWPLADEPGFEWLDAPARDLRRLLGPDGGGVAGADEAEKSEQEPTLDLFEVSAKRKTSSN